jgi:SAM-dependent methyltransferase
VVTSRIGLVFIRFIGVPLLGKNTRFRLLEKIIERVKIQPLDSIIDYGAGNGEVTIFMGLLGVRVHCIEINKVFIQRIESFSRAKKLDVELYSDLSFSEKVDAAICLSVLDYLADPLRELIKILSLVKPGGVLIISIPNQNRRLGKRWQGCINGSYLNSGFDIAEVDSILYKNNFYKEFEEGFMPLNIFKYYDYLDSRFKSSFIRLINYCIFEVINRVVSASPYFYRTETMIVYRRLYK